ncbi:hypothetical protein [Christiangramia sp.]|uniref:hypothetical protein n=1 Tax=Christiangramia sp. TaxID=1931228 RepID=UPI00260A5BC3|nr:hypothetical protein [Christiangramia sp.]
MKTAIFAIIIMFFSADTCSKQEMNSIESFNYETFTRGSTTMYTVTSENVKVKSSDLNSKEKSKSITAEEWNFLIGSANKIEASKMSQLKAPTNSRVSDEALHAILSIRKNDTIYKTNSFDHGNPPAEVKPLVEAILRLAENVE